MNTNIKIGSVLFRINQLLELDETLAFYTIGVHEISVPSNDQRIILEKLEKQGLIKIIFKALDQYNISKLGIGLSISESIVQYPNGAFQFAIDDIKKFKDYYTRFKLENPDFDENAVNTIIYKVTYSKYTKEIKINEFFLAKPDFDSINERLFNYIYDNPNQDISVDELFSNVNIDKNDKSIHSILFELGFSGILKEVFFNASNKGIHFTNPIYRSHLEERNIRYLSLKDINKKSK